MMIYLESLVVMFLINARFDLALGLVRLMSGGLEPPRTSLVTLSLFAMFNVDLLVVVHWCHLRPCLTS